MEFVHELTYILWTFVLCQLIASTVTLKVNNNDTNTLLEAVINEMEALKAQVNEIEAQSENKVSALRSEMEAVKLANANLKEELDDFKSAIADIKSTQLDNFVSFTAVTSTDLQHESGAAIIFDTVLRNYGNWYSSETGIFTCTVSGYYLWFANIYTNDDNDMSAEIYIQNQGSPMPELLSPGSGHDNGSNLGVSYCEAGSGVWVRVTELGGWNVDSVRFRVSSFTGVLLSIVV